MTEVERPVHVERLEFAEDITSYDAGGLHNFLIARMADLAERLEPGTEEHAAITSLAGLVVHDGISLQDSVGQRFDMIDEGHADGSGHWNQLCGDIHLDWNQLCRSPPTWSTHPDHDAARWNELRYESPAHKQLVESVTAKAAAARR
ncbi:hypothetical protein GXW82_17330 [Streptacidiphilus sp. 4-A2]|nr:hypothetical protein [Streptacidiphilus sp. 4-A2]